MGNTLEVIKFRDVIRVTDVTRFVPGLAPLTVELRGEDFSLAEEVEINDVRVPEFIIINKTTIFAQLPENVKTVRRLSVVSAGFTRTAEASRIEYRVGDKTRAISGILKLTQLFIRWLLTSPGSDIFNPQDGGGLQEVAAVVGNTKRPEPVMAAVVRAVTQTADQIRRSQQSSPGLPLSERLLSATIEDLGVISDSEEVRIRVRLESFAGDEAIPAIAL